jgi:hypothetical protein
MDRSVTYFEDVAAISVSLQLMHSRSGVPLLRFTSTFEVLHSGPSPLETDVQATREAYVTPIRANPSLSEGPLDFAAESISY